MTKKFEDSVRILITPSHSKKNCRRLVEIRLKFTVLFHFQIDRQKKIDYLDLKTFDVGDLWNKPSCCLKELILWKMKFTMTNAHSC